MNMREHRTSEAAAGTVLKKTGIISENLVDVTSHNLKNGKEASKVTEGKSSRMRWGR